MPVMAIVGDKFLPRKTWIALALTLLALIAWPLGAWMISSNGSLVSVVTSHLLLFALLSVPLGSGPALFVELFPQSDRLSGYSVSFNVGMGVFGGMTPMIATTLIEKTGDPLAPFYYMITAAAIAALVLSKITDRSRGPLL